MALSPPVARISSTPVPAVDRTDHPQFVTFAPFIFVLFWSTGFIGARYGLPYAEPFTYLALRMGFAAALMVGLTIVLRADWPRDLVRVGHYAVSGLLLHAGYLGGVFFAISRGMPAGLSSLVVGLQPILVAVLAQRTLGERLINRQWLGLVLGFGGVAIVVIERMRANGGLHGSTSISAGIGILIALLATTLGTVYQKRFCLGMPLASGTAVQYGATGILMLLLAWSTETMSVDWTARFIFALTWQVIVLSLLAITLLMILIRQNSVSRVSSYLYLVPPLTAIEAYFMFDERLNLSSIAGMVVVAFGVLLVIRSTRKVLA